MIISSFRKNLFDWLNTPTIRYSILAIILVNAILLGLETSPTIMLRYGFLLHTLDSICLTIFVIELALKLFSRGFFFFRDPWNLFDFFIIGI